MCPGIETAQRSAQIPSTWGRTFLGAHPIRFFPCLAIIWPLFPVAPSLGRHPLTRKTEEPLTAFLVSKRGIFQFEVRIMAETVLGVLLRYLLYGDLIKGPRV